MKRIYAIRGAAGAENDARSIKDAVVEMCLGIFRGNSLSPEDIVSIHFTQTGDLTAMNPAAALRKGQDEFDVSGVALFCSQEPKIDGSPEKIVRVMVTCYLEENSAIHHVYINGAQKLRPDFSKKI